MIDDRDSLLENLEELKARHRRMDREIEDLSELSPFNQLKIQRLKKEKLKLKDAIITLESELYPDIIA